MPTDPVHTDHFPPRALLVRQTISIDVTASELSSLRRSLEVEAEAAIAEGKENYADFVLRCVAELREAGR